jgi:hypothetical protein
MSDEDAEVTDEDQEGITDDELREAGEDDEH